jgi:hypothetical protein
MRRRDACLGLAATGWRPAAGDAPLRARIPRPPRGTDLERFYPLRVLQAALRASGQPHQIEFSQGPVIQARALRELEEDSGVIDLIWTMASRERMQALRAVPVPLYMGLYGWRLLLVRRGESGRFARVQRLSDLEPFRLAQGSDWPDTEILGANGLKVVGSPSFESLFTQLAQGEVDAFPRSALEIWPEADAQAARFEVEPRLVLRYPTAMLFFTAPGNVRLAQALEAGLRQMRADGELLRLLELIHADDLQLARLDARRRIDLQNPLLPRGLVLEDYQPRARAPR